MPPESKEVTVEQNGDKIPPSSDPRVKLRSWLGQILRIEITDRRVIVGGFACTDRDGNIILENSWEYAQASDYDEKQEPRMLGLALVPGKHIISVCRMT